MPASTCGRLRAGGNRSLHHRRCVRQTVAAGIGRISGVVIGVLVFELLKSSMQFLGIPTNYQYSLHRVSRYHR
ncbi:MAG: hypothetical protein ACLUD2_12855 [Clostridium sp.]